MRRGIDVVRRGRAIAFFALLALSALAFVASAPDRRAPAPIVALFDTPSLTTTHDGATEIAREPRGNDARTLRRSNSADPGRFRRSGEGGASAALVASGGGTCASRWTWACVQQRARGADRRRDDPHARSMVRLN